MNSALINGLKLQKGKKFKRQNKNFTSMRVAYFLDYLVIFRNNAKKEKIKKTVINDRSGIYFIKLQLQKCG